ncbi:MAG: sodium:solute symporter, partial [Pyrinomonadaceae bacterium]
FVKIPVQFLILLVGVLVFVFYQFERPPLVFNAAAERRVAEGARAADYAALGAEYAAAHEERERAAVAYVRARRAGARAEEEERARAEYVLADGRFNTTRLRGVALVRADGGDRNFTDVNYVFPTFVVAQMPAGVVGLIIAAIFAAAMSSISAELNALATATTIDFYRRHYRPEADDRHYVRVGRIATAVWGVFACGVALYATSLGSLIEVVNRFGSFFYGSLLGVFVLAVGVRRARARGAFWGLLAGMLSVWVASHYTDIAFLWFNLIGCAVVVAVGYLLSLTDRRTPAHGAETL